NAMLLDHLLVNRTIKQNYDRHSVENNLAYLELVNAKQLLPKHDYEIHLSPADLVWGEQFIEAHRLEGRILVGIHVGSGGTKNLALRRWPLPAYVDLINGLIREHSSVSVLLFGGPDEAEDQQTVLA